LFRTSHGQCVVAGRQVGGQLELAAGHAALRASLLHGWQNAVPITVHHIELYVRVVVRHEFELRERNGPAADSISGPVVRSVQSQEGDLPRLRLLEIRPDRLVRARRRGCHFETGDGASQITWQCDLQPALSVRGLAPAELDIASRVQESVGNGCRLRFAPWGVGLHKKPIGGVGVHLLGHAHLGKHLERGRDLREG
jgi:hypothetical protein